MENGKERLGVKENIINRCSSYLKWQKQEEKRKGCIKKSNGKAFCWIDDGQK